MRFLKVTHYLLTRITILVLLLLLLVSGYFLWSNSRTYSAAEDVYESLLQLKPEETEEGKADFSELRKANPDVCGWLTVTGTKIDYPVVQGKDNLYYMNRDYYGNPSLAGSIFLDTRNSSSFSDAYSLVYGHHMDDHLMFGDLDLFKDEQFFRLNSTATILTEDRVLHLQVLALLEQPDSVEEIFDPSRWESDLSQFGAFIKDNAVYVRESALKELRDNPTLVQAVSLVTCASGHTGTRTVLVLIAPRTDSPGVPEGDVPSETPSKPPAKTGDTLFNSPMLWGSLLGVSLMTLIAVRLIEKRRKKN